MRTDRLPRLMPCLLLRGSGLVKTRRFREPTYVGDPINAVRIFNEKEVDELIVLDIEASRAGRGPNLALIEQIASECFMPVTYGGGLRDPEQVASVLRAGVEKVSVNTIAREDPGALRRIADRFGSQSLVVSIDVERSRMRRAPRVYGTSRWGGAERNPVELAKAAQAAGAGEILLTSVDREGTYSGYDLELVRQVAPQVDIPLIACGGARNLDDVAAVLEAGADGAAAGSLFVFQGPLRAVLINFPTPAERRQRLA